MTVLSEEKQLSYIIVTIILECSIYFGFRPVFYRSRIIRRVTSWPLNKISAKIHESFCDSAYAAGHTWHRHVKPIRNLPTAFLVCKCPYCNSDLFLWVNAPSAKCISLWDVFTSNQQLAKCLKRWGSHAEMAPKNIVMINGYCFFKIICGSCQSPPRKYTSSLN